MSLCPLLLLLLLPRGWPRGWRGSFWLIIRLQPSEIDAQRCLVHALGRLHTRQERHRELQQQWCMKPACKFATCDSALVSCMMVSCIHSPCTELATLLHWQEASRHLLHMQRATGPCYNAHTSLPLYYQLQLSCCYNHSTLWQCCYSHSDDALLQPLWLCCYSHRTLRLHPPSGPPALARPVSSCWPRLAAWQRRTAWHHAPGCCTQHPLPRPCPHAPGSSRAGRLLGHPWRSDGWRLPA